MTDLCRAVAQGAIDHFQLTTATVWVWVQEEGYEGNWEWLSGHENTERREEINRYIDDLVSKMELTDIFTYLTSSDYDAVQHADQPEFVLNGDEKSLKDVLASILGRTITDLMEEMIQRPVDEGK